MEEKEATYDGWHHMGGNFDWKIREIPRLNRQVMIGIISVLRY
jgi:hypothetical protein